MPVTLSSKSKRASKKSHADQDLITTSLKRFQITSDAESEWRKQAIEDLRFSIGTGQWDEAVKANREIEGKPCLTVNRAPAFLRQYTGEERQHRPAMIVSPVGNGADQEVAKIHQGVLRHIEVASVADVTYDTSYDMMMRIGACPWRIVTDYISETSFFQEPRIVPIENPFTAYLSPIRQPDGTDPLWAHIITDLSKEEYQEKYGKDSQLARLNFPSQAGAAPPEWVTKDGVRIAEYWWIELTKEILLQFPDGSTHLKKDVKDETLLETSVAERETVIRKVCCVKHNAMEVLERNDYLGRYIPIPEVNGVRLNVNGKIYKAGMVRDYRDAQRIYDFMVTRQVEQVDLYGKDPLWEPVDNAQWAEDRRRMNRSTQVTQYYKPYDAEGKQLPPPFRLGKEPPIMAMSEVVKQADYDMKAVIGIYGPSLGEESGNAQESGFAIMSRQEQTDTGSITWHDNLNRAIMYQGKILLDLWPKLIDSARLQRIINPDDSVKHVAVYNSQYSGPGEAQNLLNDQEAVKKAYDVGAGDYDVVLSSGPMYKTARKEAFKALTAVIAEDPQQMMPILGDIWAKNADFPDADLMASRFKKMLPPQLQDQDADDPAAQAAQKDAALAALTAQHNQMLAELARATDTIRTDRLAVESKERIAAMQSQTQIALQILKTEGQAGLAQVQAINDAINHRLELLHESMSVEQEAGDAPQTPELPGKVEPKPLPVTPGQPVQPVQPIPGGA